MGYFKPFYLCNSPKKENFKKITKCLETSWFYVGVPKIMVICYTVPEIWCMMNVIVFHFGLFFCPFAPLTAQEIKISKKWQQLIEIQSLYTSAPKIIIICHTVLEIWHMTDVIAVFHFGQFFALLPPKNEHFKTVKKTHGDSILHKYTRNNDHMLYCSRDKICGRCYFSFWAIFYPFTLLKVRNIKISKKMKKNTPDIIILHKCTKNHDHRL